MIRSRKKTQGTKRDQMRSVKNLQNLRCLESVFPDAPFSAAAGRPERGSLRDPSLSFVPSARRIFFLSCPLLPKFSITRYCSGLRRLRLLLLWLRGTNSKNRATFRHSCENANTASCTARHVKITKSVFVIFKNSFLKIYKPPEFGGLRRGQFLTSPDYKTKSSTNSLLSFLFFFASFLLFFFFSFYVLR